MSEFHVEALGPSPFLAGFMLYDAYLPNNVRMRFPCGGAEAPFFGARASA